MFTTIIIDDEPKSISSLKFVIEKNCPQIKVLETARSADEGFEKIKAHNPDIIFLDVEMPYGSGFDLLNKFIGCSFEIIFVTAYENFAVKAFKVNAVDYILKPFTEDDIIAAIKKATERVQEKKLIHASGNSTQKKNNIPFSKRIAVPAFDGLAFLNVEDIIRCEASENYTYFFLKDKKKILVCKGLTDYEEMLASFDFHRIHQSHLINLAYVSKYVKGRGGYVVMQDGITVDVSARKKMEFLESIFK
jgi:two-component system, LytTR family, response regulator